MRRIRARLGTFMAIALTSALATQAGTLHGTVKNGTTGKPAAGVEVILIQLQGGMQPVANSKSDAQGQFTFENPSLGAQPMLVRAVYKEINFHQPVPPGRNDVEVSIFEPSKDPKTISIGTRIVFFQPSGDLLTVGEEYSVENNSQPPKAYFRSDGSFDFAIPDNAKLQQVATSGPTGMPVVQSAIDKKKSRYAIAYAFRPGLNTVRYSYEMPYPGNAASVKVPMIYPASRLLVIAPPTVQISGDGLQAGGQEQGMNIYGRENVAANTALTVLVSGTAPLEASGGADTGSRGRDAQQSEAPSGSVTLQQIPGRLDVLKWPLIVGFLGVFGLGAILLARRPVVAMAGGTPIDSASAQSRKAKSLPTKNTKSPSSLADVDAAVDTSLEALKDQLFRLELRRQAGTITEQEYAQERARAEKVLRELVRG